MVHDGPIPRTRICIMIFQVTDHIDVFQLTLTSFANTETSCEIMFLFFAYCCHVLLLFIRLIEAFKHKSSIASNTSSLLMILCPLSESIYKRNKKLWNVFKCNLTALKVYKKNCQY